MLVHADDLAVSVGLDPLVLPGDSARLAIQSLVDISRHREGDLTVLRALSRRERQSAEALGPLRSEGPPHRERPISPSPGTPVPVVLFDAVDDTVIATEPSGQRWGVVVAAPGTLDDVLARGSGAGGFLLSGLFAGSRGWRVVVYRIDEHDRWKGPVGRQKVKDQAAASAASDAIVGAIRTGRFSLSFRG